MPCSPWRHPARVDGRPAARARTATRGAFFFLEHVAASPGTLAPRVQDVVFRPHRWCFNGCETNRDTAAAIRSSPWASPEIVESC
jgi:hypothetical protein